MDEPRLMSLIAEGEHEGLDFKRELHLEEKDDKGEFVKDVISIANAAPGHKGYILVGVDKDKLIVGVNGLEEERIQQIAHRYIRPAVTLRCSLVPLQVAGLPVVGVIEIKGTERPYSVTSPIGALKQDDCFFRHGSVVTKATSEEVHRMQEESWRYNEIVQLVKAAETHLSLGNLKEAIYAYSEAVKTMPTSELFLARGKAYELQMRRDIGEYQDLRKRAHKDFSDAIKLATSEEVEKEARLGRVRMFVYSWDEREKDLEWLKVHTKGREHGEVLYWEVEGWEARSEESVAQQAILLLSQAIQLGYRDPGVYYLRAQANFDLCNYRLALQDIEIAISGTKETDELVDRLCLRANILVRMGQFRQAYKSFSQARQSCRGEFHDYWRPSIWEIEDEILWRYSIAYEFGELGKSEVGKVKAIFEVLVAWRTGKDIVRTRRERGGGQAEISKILVQFDSRYHEVADVIMGIIGQEFWQIYEEIRQGELGLNWVRVEE